MSVHRPYLMHPIPDDMSSNEPSRSTRSRKVRNASRERCIEVAVELVRMHCSVWDCNNRVSSTLLSSFFYIYFVFDGAVALAGALSQTPPHPRATECLELMDRAVTVLNDCVDSAKRMGASNGEGEIARRAIVVLQALRKAGGWSSSSESQSGIRKQTDSKIEGAPSATISSADQSVIQDASIPQRSYSNAQDLFADFSLAPVSHHNGTSSPFVATPPSGYQPSQSPPVSALLPDPSSAFTPPTVPPGSNDLFLGDSTTGNVKLNTQSFMLPFEMLLSGNGFDSEWARVAGMENWNQSSSCLGRTI